MPQRVTRSAVFVAMVLGLAAGLIVVRYFATTQEMLVIARAVQGVGGAIVSAVAL